MVVGEQHADHEGPCGSGKVAVTLAPPASSGPARSVPPSSSARSRIAVNPTPGIHGGGDPPSSSTRSTSSSRVQMSRTQQCRAPLCRTTLVTASTAIRNAATSTAAGSSGRSDAWTVMAVSDPVARRSTCERSAVVRPRSRAEPIEPRLRRAGLAAALLLAPWAIVATNTGWAIAQSDGAKDETGADQLAAAAAHPTLLHATVLLGMIGALLMIPATLAAARVAGRGAAKLSFVAGTLSAAGYACYLAVLAPDLRTIAAARLGTQAGDYAAVVDTAQQDNSAVWVFLIFVIGNVVGTFLIGLALWRSRAVARWTAAAVMAWPLMHIVGLSLTAEAFEVAGAVVQGVAFAAIGARLLRRHSPTT
jgi:hypothetical protein